MLAGLMQDDFPLTLHHIRRRMRSCNRGAEVVTLTGDGRRRARASHGEVSERVDRLARALAELGVEQGDRVGTFAWNNQRHFELYFAVPCMGAVLHTLNIRLFERAAHLHRQPRRGPGHLRRRLARAAAGEARAELRDASSTSS